MDKLKEVISNINSTWRRPDAKRKLLIAFIYFCAFALSIAEIVKDLKSLTAWGSALALTLMAVSAWPYVKDFIWPSGLEHTAVTQLTLACHYWKVAYFPIDCDLDKRMKTVMGENIWDNLLASSKHRSTKENIERYRVLFEEEAKTTMKKIEAVIDRYSDVLPERLRVLAQNTVMQLGLAPLGFKFFKQNPTDEGFFAQFQQIINALHQLDGPAGEHQNITKSSQ